MEETQGYDIPNAKKVYKNYTVGLDEITYSQLKDLALLNRTSIRNYLTNLVLPEYEKNKESILKIRATFDSINSIDSAKNASISTREQQS